MKMWVLDHCRICTKRSGRVDILFDERYLFRCQCAFFPAGQNSRPGGGMQTKNIRRLPICTPTPSREFLSTSKTSVPANNKPPNSMPCPDTISTPFFTQVVQVGKAKHKCPPTLFWLTFSCILAVTDTHFLPYTISILFVFTSFFTSL